MKRWWFGSPNLVFMCFSAKTRTVPCEHREGQLLLSHWVLSEKMKSQDNFLRRTGSWHGDPPSFWGLARFHMESTWEQIKWGWFQLLYSWVRDLYWPQIMFQTCRKAWSRCVHADVLGWWGLSLVLSTFLCIMQMWQQVYVFEYDEAYILKDQTGTGNWPLRAVLRANSNPLVLIWVMLMKLVCVHTLVASLRQKGCSHLDHEMSCWRQNPLATYVVLFLGWQKEVKRFPKWDRKFKKNEIIFIVGERQKK